MCTCYDCRMNTDTSVPVANRSGWALAERYAHLLAVAAELWPDAPAREGFRAAVRLTLVPEPMTVEEWQGRQARRARRAVDAARDLPAWLRVEVLAAGRCAYCGEPGPTEVDHVVPVTQGGTRARSNLAAACYWCNREKGPATPAQWRAWRESEGLPWPPPTRLALIAAVASQG